MKSRPPRSPRARLLLVALALAALLAGGCGGGGKARSGGRGNTQAPSSSAEGARALQQSRFIATAEEICRHLNITFPHDRSPHPSTAEIAASAPRNAALERTTAEELARLSPPLALAASWKQIVAYRRMLAEELLALARSAKTNDTAALSALSASKKRLHQKLGETATRMGFKECAHIGPLTSAHPSPSAPGARAAKPTHL